MEDGSHGGGSPPGRTGGGTPARKESQGAKESTKHWQGHPPPGGGGAGPGTSLGRPPSSRKISPPSPLAKTVSPESGRTRKSPTPEPTRVRKSPTPDPGGRVRKSPTPDRPLKSPSPAKSQKKTNKSPASQSPRGGSPQKTRPRKSPEAVLRQSKSLEEQKPTVTETKQSPMPVTESDNGGSHYARPTIIDDGDDELEDEVKDQMPVIAKKEFNRSISEPPEGTIQEVNPARKMSEGEGTGGGNLTGMFFQKLIEKEDGQSNTSLASQDSGKSFQSRSSSSPRQSFLHSPAGKTLTPGKSRGSPSPNLSGSTFSINRHKKVELASFDTADPIPKKREMRFSHGEDKTPDVFDSNMIKKAASVAHVESFSKTVKQGTIKTTDKTDKAEVEKFTGKELLNVLSSGFSDDNYLKITLTNKDYNFIAKQFGVQLLGLGVLKSAEPGENSIKVSHSYNHLSVILMSPALLTTLMTFPMYTALWQWLGLSL